MSSSSRKKVVEVDGDGNCMFRSIVQAYHAENTHVRDNDGCKHAQHQAFVYKLHHHKVPLFIEQEIKRMCH